MTNEDKIKSVAVIGAGAAGAVTAAALKAENYFETIRVFERREAPGGTWLYDASPDPSLPVQPGRLPPETDPPLDIPEGLPQTLPPNQQERFSKTPVYNSLTTNVPDVAMCFSDSRFAYGPFVPHYVARQYVESYFSLHKTDSLLALNTTVEDVTRLASKSRDEAERWKLTLRKYDSVRKVDIWWEELFDAVVLANGHYSVPHIPYVPGLEAYIAKFPNRVVHSKYYRSPAAYRNQRVLVIGNSASGHDLTAELVTTAAQPVYQSRRSKSHWDGPAPPPGIAWKPVITEYRADAGRILFADGSHLDDVDHVIYCTGYLPSFPFWNAAANGRPLWDYAAGRLLGGYWHTFFQDFPSLGVVGLPRTLTFRSFEYQAVALARLWAGRNALALPSVEEQRRWERERAERTRAEGRKFHDIPWENGETKAWLDGLFRLAGLGTLMGEGRIPPVLDRELVWAVEHVRKYPDPEKDEEGVGQDGNMSNEEDWVVVQKERKDLLAFI